TEELDHDNRIERYIKAGQFSAQIPGQFSAQINIGDGSVVWYAMVFVLSGVIHVGMILWWSERRWNIVRSSLKLIAWTRLAIFLVGVALLAWYAQTMRVSGLAWVNLMTSAVIFGVPYLLAVTLIYKKKLLVRSV
uniref:hypothetical protein n=2 Tax=Martelella sp. AD-3 TaxID=686597 RepID=UPI0005644DF8